MSRKIVLNIIIALLFFCNANAQIVEENIEIGFNLGQYKIEPNIYSNVKNIQYINDLVKKLEADSLFSITSITINSYASPEGDSYYNKRLSANRSKSLYNYLTNKLSIKDSLITIYSNGVEWGQLRKMVDSSNMAYKNEVLDIIDNVPYETWKRVKPNDRWLTLVDSRNKHLMDLRRGIPYKYMAKEFFSKMRRTSIVTVTYKRLKNPALDKELSIKTPTLNNEEIAIRQKEVLKEASKLPMPITTRPYFALKTNLLFDVATLANVELEVPVAQRWSAAAEWIFPWWLWEKKQNCIQILSGNLEARYWIKPNNKNLKYTLYNPLAGWFVGLYGGGGLYDLEREKVGYQGEFYIATGVSAGYVHPFTKSLLMEFSLGVGYMNTHYRKYEAKYSNVDDKWHLIRQYNGSQTWIGPTRAKISLVWYPHFKKRGGKQ